MNGYLEIEYSALLTQIQFETLVHHLNLKHGIQQDNHYYQYNDPQVRIAARIRIIDRNRILTFKTDQDVGRMEYNFLLTTERDPFLRDDVLSFLDSHHLKAGFTPIGIMTTHRYTLDEGEYEICLDKNHYLGVVDYELEVESKSNPQRAKQRFEELCGLVGIKDENPNSKFARFLKQKRL